MHEDFYVYAISKLGYCSPDYIGKGKGNRAYRHLVDCFNQDYPSYNLPFYHELRNYYPRDENGKILADVEFLYTDLSEEKAFYFESIEIARFGRRNNNTGCLSNISEGGSVTSGFAGHRHSEFSKLRISSKLIGRHTTSSFNWLGKNHSIESRIRMSRTRLNFSKEKKAEIARRIKLEKGKVICSYNLASNQIVKIYESIRDAQYADKYSRAAIVKVLNGRKSSYANLGWRELTDEEIERFIIKKELL